LRWLRARLIERACSAFERRWLPGAAACIVLSEEDRAEVARYLGSARVHVVPNGVDVARYEFRRTGQPGRIVFTGNFSWAPNVDAARRFATAIFPLIKRQWPAAEFVIAGAEPVPAVRALAAIPDVRVTGTVPDLRRNIWSATVYVSPLRAGFGVKNKILEAPSFVSVTEFTSTEVNLLVSGKTQPSDQWAVTSEMRRRIFTEFEKKKIQLSTAFPALAASKKK